MLVIQTLLFLIGGISIAYGFLVVSIIGFSAFFNFAFVLIGSVLLCTGLFLKKIFLLPKWLLTVALILIIVLLINFTVTQIKLWTFECDPSDDAEYVIILGCKVNHSGPSLEFERRINAAAEFAKTHPSCRIITTGGKGPDEPEAEGDAAKKRLVDLGIQEDRIIAENKSTTTRENLQFAAVIAEKEDGKSLADSDVVIVSSKFHLLRASKYADAEGFNNTSFIGAVGKKILLPQYYLREYGGILYEGFRGMF